METKLENGFLGQIREVINAVELCSSTVCYTVFSVECWNTGKLVFKNLKMVENQIMCTLVVLKKGEVNISISFHVKSNVQLRS